MTTISTSAPFRLLRFAGLATTLALGASFGLAQTTSTPPPDDGPDPALVNMAPTDQTPAPDQSPADTPSVQTPQTPSSNPQDYLQQTPAPIVRSAPKPATQDHETESPDAPAPDNAITNQPAAPQADAQIAAGEAALDDTSADTDTFADQPPPPLPDYDQPPAPADDYIWTPGYWAYAPIGFYWVPGVWVLPPYYGALWTPPYWGWYGGRYRWRHGYWGLHVGFYGGINYGYGYIGTGYFGGYWNHGHFFYNRTVTNVGSSVTNIYTHTVVYNNHQFGARPINNISYNGGRGGINATPHPAEVIAMHEAHAAPLPAQLRLHQTAAQNPQAAYIANRGRPTVTVQSAPLGANRTIAPSPAAFQPRANTNVQQPHSTIEQPRFQVQQPRPQPQIQQPRPAPQPQYRPAPPPAPRPAEVHSAPPAPKH